MLVLMFVLFTVGIITDIWNLGHFIRWVRGQTRSSGLPFVAVVFYMFAVPFLPVSLAWKVMIFCVLFAMNLFITAGLFLLVHWTRQK
jgi:hypothetical protein